MAVSWVRTLRFDRRAAPQTAKPPRRGYEFGLAKFRITSA